MKKIRNICEYFKIRGEFYYFLINYFSKKKLSINLDSYVISITSYPQRINKLYLTIESIFDQEAFNGIVHLWLSEQEFPDYKLPKSLVRLKKRGLKITFVKNNIKSYKKLIYSLIYYSNRVIITVDDDIIYPKYWLDGLLLCHNNFPKDIICYRGHNLLLETRSSVKPYVELMFNTLNYFNEASFTLMPTGVSGVLYPINSLHKEVLNIDKFLKLAPSGDDIWFKCCSLLNRTKVRKVYPENLHFHIISNSQKTSLYRVNLLESKNDDQIKALFDEYNLYDLLVNEQNIIQNFT